MRGRWLAGSRPSSCWPSQATLRNEQAQVIGVGIPVERQLHCSVLRVDAVPVSAHKHQHTETPQHGTSSFYDAPRPPGGPGDHANPLSKSRIRV
jgi:hypothetical protein